MLLQLKFVLSNCFLVDGNYCLSCGADKTIKLWNPYTGALLKTYSGTGWEVSAIDIF